MISYQIYMYDAQTTVAWYHVFRSIRRWYHGISVTWIYTNHIKRYAKTNLWYDISDINDGKSVIKIILVLTYYKDMITFNAFSCLVCCYLKWTMGSVHFNCSNGNANVILNPYGKCQNYVYIRFATVREKSGKFQSFSESWKSQGILLQVREFHNLLSKSGNFVCGPYRCICFHSLANDIWTRTKS